MCKNETARKHALHLNCPFGDFNIKAVEKVSEFKFCFSFVLILSMCGSKSNVITQRCLQVDVPLAKERKQAWREDTAAHGDKTQVIKGRGEKEESCG